jgi:bacterial/archaeal transporter family-2 protein
MDKGLAVLLMAAVGGLLALQAPINAGLGKITGSFPAAFISFAVGTLALAIVVVAAGKAGDVGEATNASWYYLIGGLLGAVYVFTALVLVKEIGAGGVAAATIASQLTTAVILDRLGAFGLEQTPLTWDRLLGVALLFAGTYLVVR